MNATSSPVKLTGKVKIWRPIQGFGFIEVDNFEGRQTFYAHAKEFLPECTCGRRHKCEIGPGMMVEFVVEFNAQRPGKLPVALQIREVKG